MISCPHFSVGGARTWSLILALAEIGTFVCHFYFKTPFEKVTQILGATPSEKEQQALWGFLALMTIIRLALAYKPMCRSIAQLSAIFHCLEVVPLCYLAVTNVLLRYKEVRQIDLVGAGVIIAMVLFNASIFYNYWMDRLTGEIRSTTVSAARASSTTAAASPKKSIAARLAPPPRKKSASAAVAEKSEASAAAPTPARKSASPKKKAASKPKKAASKPKKSASKPKRAASSKKK